MCVTAVYPSLDLSDNEEESISKSRVVAKQDELWNPRGTEAESARFAIQYNNYL